MKLNADTGKTYSIELARGCDGEVDLKINGRYAICFFPNGDIDFIGMCYIKLSDGNTTEITRIGELI